ncbi:MAG: hypothetical protein WA140_05275 [Geobacteraceae bacterium]
MRLLKSFSSRAAMLSAAAMLCLSGCAHKEGVRQAAGGAAADHNLRVVIFPVDNMSGGYAPVADIRGEWTKKLTGLGLRIVDDETLEKYMTKYRIRSIGGVDSVSAKAFREEAGADAILITSLEYYSETYPPKIALISRLVSTGERPRILWMESVGLAGDDSPGILDLGLVTDYKTLQGTALQRLADSLARWLRDKKNLDDAGEAERKFRPKLIYNASPITAETRTSIAVVPLYNESTRKRAGEITQLHFIRELLNMKNVEAIEPGIVREKMLGIRMIMREGVSFRDADILTYVLEADYVLSGTVFDYQDSQGGGGTPRIDFSALMIEKSNRKLVFKSKSYNKGDDRVFFYDVGRHNNASEMAGKMVRNVVRKMVKGEW